MPSPFDALKPLAGRALEVALNRAVALDPDTRDALAALDGRRVSLALDAPPLALQIGVHGGYLQVGPPVHEDDLAVRGSVGGLLGQLPFFAQAATGRPAGRLHVSGDASLAQRLQKLAAGFDPDWQQPFVASFGQVLGVQLANAAAAALREAREESGLAIRLDGLVNIYSYPGRTPIIIVYAATCTGGEIAIDDESLEARAFQPSGIPWTQLAFRSTAEALRDFLAGHLYPPGAVGPRD